MAQSGGKCKKADRNKIKCTKYKSKNTQEVNKIAKLVRHIQYTLKKGAKDTHAVNALVRLNNSLIVLPKILQSKVSAIIKGYNS